MTSTSIAIDLILPVRSIDDGKRRLQSLLTTGQRRQLNRQFLDHALSTGRQMAGIRRIWVVSGCPQTRDLARARGACTLPDPDIVHPIGPEARMNGALAHAFAMARAQGAADVLIGSVDLPYARAQDFDTLCGLARAGGEARCVIATDEARQGTNAIFIPVGHRLDFAFGRGSCQRHADNARRNGGPAHIAHIANLAFDIDTPADYLRWKRSQSAVTPWFGSIRSSGAALQFR